MQSSSSAIVSLIVNSLILYYVFKLDIDNCKCSDNDYREYIKYLTLTLILISLTLTVIGLNFIKLPLNYMMISIVVLSIIKIIVSIFNVYYVYHFIKDVKDCDCATSNYALYETIKVFNFMQIGSIIIFAIGLVLMMFLPKLSKFL